MKNNLILAIRNNQTIFHIVPFFPYCSTDANIDRIIIFHIFFITCNIIRSLPHIKITIASENYLCFLSSIFINIIINSILLRMVCCFHIYRISIKKSNLVFISIIIFKQFQRSEKTWNITCWHLINIRKIHYTIAINPLGNTIIKFSNIFIKIFVFWSTDNISSIIAFMEILNAFTATIISIISIKIDIIVTV